MSETYAHAPTYYRLYVWEYPVRFFHWLNAACITALAITGYLIGTPFHFSNAAEAYQAYWIGLIRFTHFVSAWVLMVNFGVRLYWGFVGDQYAQWHHFFPFRKHQRRELAEVLRVDLLQVGGPGHFSSGHNAAAGLAYLILLLAVAFQIVTGFGLYASTSDAWLPGLFAWIVPLMGGDAEVRFWHHAAMWFFIVFTLAHIYVVFYHDYVEGRGTLSSMAGGWKFARTDRFEPVQKLPSGDEKRVDLG